MTAIPRRLFCSDAARLRGDDNTATAGRTDVWLLVEFPGTWGRDPLHDATLPAPVRDALTRATRAIARSRLLFIRRRHAPSVGCRVYVARTAPFAAVTSLQLESLEDVANLDFVALSERPAESDAPMHELVLICTHGQRDSCCGRRGYPLYDALCRRAELDVWQCSHVGGDRFAANAVVLPWGLFYGPVETAQSDAFADSILRGEILVDAFRGRSSFSRPAQAAETFVRRASGIVGRDALRVVAREPLPDGRFRVVLRDDAATLHDVTLEQFTAEESAMLTCTATAANPIPQFRMTGYTTRPA